MTRLFDYLTRALSDGEGYHLIPLTKPEREDDLFQPPDRSEEAEGPNLRKPLLATGSREPPKEAGPGSGKRYAPKGLKMQGAELKSIRTELELTQAGMAQALGLTRPHYALLETGARPIDFGTGMLARLMLNHLHRRDEAIGVLKQFEAGMTTQEAIGDAPWTDTTEKTRARWQQTLVESEGWLARLKAGKAGLG